jgi:uncharacterized protein
MSPSRFPLRSGAAGQPAPRPAAVRAAGLRALRVAALLLALVLALPGIAARLGATEGYAQAEVVIHGHVFRVDVADTPEKQTLGLGGRRELGPLQGMLFIYADRGRQAFWMHGMFIPIDMIWLDNRRVVHIASDVPPPAPGTPDAQLPTYQPEAPANFVLELAAGRARAVGLHVGDRVQFHFDVR